MGFNSFTFILVFLPILLFGWYSLNRLQKYTLADALLVIMSLYFYYTFGVNFLIILAISIGVNYALSVLVNEIDSRDTAQNNAYKKDCSRNSQESNNHWNSHWTYMVIVQNTKTCNI